jgi:uncharacterized protein YmfQ (DUF2313 family)
VHVVSKRWTFGDNFRAIGLDPSHAYLIPGRYTPSLTIKTNYSELSISKPDYIEVSENDNPLHYQALKKLAPVNFSGEFDKTLRIDASFLDIILMAFKALLNEGYPDTANSLIKSWERVIGFSVVGTIDDKRNKIVAHLNATGGLSKQYFEQLAVSMGYVIGGISAPNPHLRIVDGLFPPFRLGISVIGDHIYDQDGISSIYHWFVYGSNVETDTLLQSVFNDLKPAWTTIQFINE